MGGEHRGGGGGGCTEEGLVGKWEGWGEAGEYRVWINGVSGNCSTDIKKMVSNKDNDGS